MQGTSVDAPSTAESEAARLESLGYRPQLNRVLGFFANFSVAFTYLSPMVGIYTLFVLGVGTGGPAYVWLTFIPFLVARPDKRVQQHMHDELEPTGAERHG